MMTKAESIARLAKALETVADGQAIHEAIGSNPMAATILTEMSLEIGKAVCSSKREFALLMLFIGASSLAASLEEFQVDTNALEELMKKPRG